MVSELAGQQWGVVARAQLRDRSRSLDARDMTTHQGIPITTIARTLLDLAATVRKDRLERALAQAERLGVYDHAPSPT
jgi:hypothetical protein